jgi:hypothetical protein
MEKPELCDKKTRFIAPIVVLSGGIPTNPRIGLGWWGIGMQIPRFARDFGARLKRRATASTC